MGRTDAGASYRAVAVTVADAATAIGSGDAFFACGTTIEALANGMSLTGAGGPVALPFFVSPENGRRQKLGGGEEEEKEDKAGRASAWLRRHGRNTSVLGTMHPASRLQTGNIQTRIGRTCNWI